MTTSRITRSERRAGRRVLIADERAAVQETKRIASYFRAELRSIRKSLGTGGRWEDGLFEPHEWADRLAQTWLSILYDREQQKSVGELVALVHEIIGSPTRATEIRRFLNDAAEGITTTTRRRITTVIREAGSLDDLDSVMKEIAKLYRTDFIQQRSQRIALDHVLRASATHTHAEAERYQREHPHLEVSKVWVTQGDNRVRDTHQAAEGQTVPISGTFLVGGTNLRYPRDPSGDFGETVNCRCTMVTRRKRRR